MIYHKYLLNNNEVAVEIAPTLTHTKDLSLDSFVCLLQANTIKNAVAPMTTFKVQESEDNILWNTTDLFVVVTDEVSIFSLNPPTYKHKLTLTQNIRNLDKHLIRNTSFVQPTNNVKKMYLSISNAITESGYGDTYRADYRTIPSNEELYGMRWQDKIIINSRDKIDSLKCRLKLFIVDKDRNFVEKDSFYIGSNKFIYSSNTIKIKNASDVIIGSFGVSETYLDVWKENDVALSLLRNAGAGEYKLDINDDVFSYPVDYTDELNNPRFITLQAEIMLELHTYSVYEVIDTLIKQTMKETDDYNATNDLYTKPLFTLPTSESTGSALELYTLLTNTISPNFTFTQCTFYQALAEIFKLFDGIFVIDENGVLGIEYLNEYGETISDPKFTGVTQSTKEEYFNNGYVAYYQSAKQTVKFPENGLANVRSQSLGVPDKNDFSFVVPKPIDFIIEGKLRTYGTFRLPIYTSNNSVAVNSTDLILDISNSLIEKSVWTLLDDSAEISSGIGQGANYNVYNQVNTIPYTKGESFFGISDYYKNTINQTKSILIGVKEKHFRRFFGFNTGWLDGSSSQPTPPANPTSGDWKNVQMSLEYISQFDGRLKVESLTNKYAGEMLVNQANGAVDLNKLGLNILGLTLLNGEPTLMANMKLCKWEDRITKGQVYIDENNDYWVANVVNYTMLNNGYVQTNIQFTKNFNALASRVQINKEKRMTNISNELTIKSEDDYCEYVYLSTTNESVNTGKYGISNYRTCPKTMRLSLLKDVVYNGVVVTSTIELNGAINKRFSISLQDGRTIGLVLTSAAVVNIGGIYNTNLTFSVAGQHPELNGLEPIFWFIETIGSNNTLTFAQAITGTILSVNYVSPGSTSVILTSASELVNSVPEPICFAIKTLSAIEKSTFDIANPYNIDFAMITPKNEDGSSIYDKENNLISNLYIPMIKYGAGNAVCLEMSMDSPINAGNELTYTEQTTWFSSYTKYFSKAKTYTDENGWADKITFDLCKLNGNFSSSFPFINSLETSYTKIGAINNFKFYKKPNEILALNYELIHLPLEDRKNVDFIGSQFINKNGFVKTFGAKETFYIYRSTTEKYSILDTKGKGSRTIISNITSSYTLNGSFTLTFTPNAYLTCISWAICDSQGNIYFASNTSLTSAASVSIYGFSRHHRI